jgi:hypothetical protein
VLRQTEDVNEYCSCGAKLPEDARFCHKCGQPQRPEDLAQPAPPELEQAEVIVPVLPEAPPKNTGINFRNSTAVRVASLAAGIVTLLFLVPMPPAIGLFWQMILVLAGGFFSVYLYGRRTGQMLNVGSGARMGWITGVFCFIIMMILFTLSVVAIATGDGVSAFTKKFVEAGGPPEMVTQMTEVLNSPSGVATLIFGALLVFFVLLPLVAAVGGALGAAVLDKD